MEIKQFKIRAHAIGHIMSGTIGLTEAQERDYQTLLTKEKRTEKQGITLAELIVKRANPELPKGVKTYCKKWLKSQLHGRESKMSNKFTEKGNINEDWSIDFIAKELGYGFLIKNKERFYNEYIEGEPDVLPDLETVIDAKNSWESDTFPLLDDEPTTTDYYWQGQGYMDLTNRNKFLLIYVLSNTPEHLIERTARQWCNNNGFEELDIDIYERFEKEMIYDDIPDKWRIKVFKYDRNDSDIQAIYERVKLCREYIEELVAEIEGVSLAGS